MEQQFKGGHALKNGTIIIFVNINKLIEFSKKAPEFWFNDFILDLKAMLTHELIHREQFLKMNRKYLEKKWTKIDLKRW